MFRWVAICLVLCLPLQWAWAAAGSPRAPACTCTSAPDSDGACDHANDRDGSDGCPVADLSGCGCLDCEQRQIPIGLLGTVVQLACGPCAVQGSEYRLRIPDPVPDHLLRPPSVQHT